MLLLTLLLPAAAAFAQDAPAPPQPAGIVGARLQDVDGLVHRLGGVHDSHPVALVFLDPECPIVRRYVPDLDGLARRAADSGVEFYGVLSDPLLTPAEGRAFRDEYEIAFPLLFDSSGDLARQLRPTHVPESYVVRTDDRLIHRGRIDDRFAAVGKPRARVEHTELSDAIDAAARGDATPATYAPPIGCVFEAWDGASESEVTYHRDIAPLLAAHCVECHQSGAIGPFEFDTYARAKRRSKMIAFVAEDRVMPPWSATPGIGSYRGEHTLTGEQIARLVEWADAGAPEGDAAHALPQPEPLDDGWAFGPPDLVVQLPEPFEVPANGDDIYQYFVVPSELVEDEDVVAMQYRPGDATVVHHVIGYLDHTGWARSMDERTEEIGFPKFGDDFKVDDDAFFQMTSVGGWAPGAPPVRYAEGLALRLPKGGDFILEVHYHLSGKPTNDRTAVGLWFAKEGDPPIERHVETTVMGTTQIDIPAGDAAYGRHVWAKLPSEVELLSLSPHMHYVGQHVDVQLTYPDGREVYLLEIADWDFRWQDTYVLREPLTLPVGTRIDASFSFDNSADNPDNPSSPPIRVGEGWRTVDEMCLLYLDFVPKDPKKIDTIHMAAFGSFMRRPIPPRR
ncbi:MAG: redoxin domain-containing protein [Planctomycetota bacterium]